jgi:Flp pilus assembly protein TadG
MMKFVLLHRFIASRKSQNGQSILAFIVLFPIFIVCLFVVTDLGRLLYLKNQVRIAADSAAIAAAGALDMSQAAKNEVFVLNQKWAEERATKAISFMQGQISEDKWMTYGLTSLNIHGLEVTVVVDGTGSTLFGGYMGIESFSARAVSHARAAVGVDSEW